jgi:hypothetical protein
MNNHSVGTARFQHPLLDRIIRSDTFEYHYTAGDAGMMGRVVDETAGAEAYLKEFYAIDHIPCIAIYMYHDLQMMNEAFGRELPNDQCCFVPIKGDISLVTFTAKIGESCIKPILVHEISHVVFSFLSGSQEINNIQQTVPLWLDEGIALYLDNKFRQNKKQIEAKRLCLLKDSKINYFPRLSSLYTYFNRLDDTVEFGPKGMMAYAYSYFSVLSLINAFGESSLVAFIKSLKNNTLCFDELFKRYFDLSLDAFDDQTKAMLFAHGQE